jgi:flavin-dependent dehydrogenase
MLVSGMPPAEPRGAVIFPLEGGQWLVSLVGSAGQYPPVDEVGFLRFARSLPVPAIAETIEGGTPLGRITGFRPPASRWRHYERLRRWPAGLVVLGDAACAFNPVYGQGMTVAAQGATLLGRWLRRSGAGGAAGFQRQLARRIALPWLMATGEDFRYPTTQGRRPGRMAWLVQRYMDGVLRLANRDPRAAIAFLEVTHFQKGPLALCHPQLVAGALRTLVLDGWGHGEPAPVRGGQAPT